MQPLISFCLVWQESNNQDERMSNPLSFTIARHCLVDVAHLFQGRAMRRTKTACSFFLHFLLKDRLARYTIGINVILQNYVICRVFHKTTTSRIHCHSQLSYFTTTHLTTHVSTHHPFPFLPLDNHPLDSKMPMDQSPWR